MQIKPESEKFGAYLRKLRKAKGWTLEEAGKRHGVHPTYFNKLELDHRGVPSPVTLRKLAELYGVTYIGMMIIAGHVTEEEVLTYRAEHGIKDLIATETG